MLTAQAIPQMTPSGEDLIGIYLCKASAVEGTEEEADIMRFITRMAPEPVPSRKLVVSPPQGGTYQALHGPILNPIEGDYSTGRVDHANAIPTNCNPEPRHCRWQYWESALTKGDWLVPSFHCVQVFSEWWVVDIDRKRRMAQQVAALDFADNPEHNLGLHELGEGLR